ncbi:hypothetical protein MA16_Dca011131 [Dendrobium catenatum]|uniref:Uncharacterized protein n=1 Tax=Dendrobium catenatum TaxID=906689 RepID=A0A2I0WSE4_9ASPA|nr:hypothetical protein MA16_Dca011131 [Dendrobium catenatum]
MVEASAICEWEISPARFSAPPLVQELGDFSPPGFLTVEASAICDWPISSNQRKIVLSTALNSSWPIPIVQE